jgi:hypothetical protein
MSKLFKSLPRALAPALDLNMMIETFFPFLPQKFILHRTAKVMKISKESQDKTDFKILRIRRFDLFKNPTYLFNQKY